MSLILEEALARMRQRPAHPEVDVAILSFFTPDIDAEMVSLQHQVMHKMADHIADIYQIVLPSHNAGVIDFVAPKVLSRYRTLILFDIDAVPLTTNGVDFLVHHAEQNRLVGAMQRSNHLKNGKHLYVPPSTLAINTWVYHHIGQPSAAETPRGDWCEEWTYACQEHGVPVVMARPSSCIEPKWPLDNDLKKELGTGVTYSFCGEELWYHNFESRHHIGTGLFTGLCRKLLL